MRWLDQPRPTKGAGAGGAKQAAVAKEGNARGGAPDAHRVDPLTQATQALGGKKRAREDGGTQASKSLVGEPAQRRKNTLAMGVQIEEMEVWRHR